MSQPRLARTDLLDTLESELDAAGFTYVEATGGKHGRLLVDVNGREEPIIVAGTPSDWRSIKNAKAHLRRKIKAWKAETAPAKNAVAVTDQEIGGHMVQSVDARELHSFLGNGEVFSTWIKARIKAYGFAEGIDFVTYLANANKGAPRQEYAITLDMAKDLSMVERNDKGRAARAYFKDCERRLVEIAAAPQSTELRASDDISALLEMLSDMQSAIMASVQRSDSHAIDRVDDVKAALLHYMKVQLKEPSYAFFDDVRARNKAAWERDRLLMKEVRDLKAAVSGLMARAEQPLLARPFIFSDWYDHAKIYDEFAPGQAIPNRGFLSRAITKSLDAYCKRRQRGFDMQSRHIGGRNVSLWHKDSVGPWGDITGREMIREHISKCRRSGDIVEFRKTR